MDELPWLLTSVGTVLLICNLILLAEIVSAYRALHSGSRNAGISHANGADKYVVLIPAHNESQKIVKTIASLKPLMSSSGSILVVADNCTDQTAKLARQSGVMVIERNDPSARGKGYALNYGLQYLEAKPPDAVIILDADCEFTSGRPAELAAESLRRGVPVQCYYAMRFHGWESFPQRISLFAWRVKNYLRPLGLRHQNLPCQLTGTGMAFPWDVIRAVNLASANLVEDMEMGINLAAAGFFPHYEPGVNVISEFPQSLEGVRSQRERWEHGHLQIITGQVPRLICQSIRKRDLRLLTMALDISVPPISLLVLFNVAFSTISLATLILFQSIQPILLSLLSGALLAAAILAAWQICARDLLRPIELLKSILHPARKAGLYMRFITRRQREWIRTARK